MYKETREKTNPVPVKESGLLIYYFPGRGGILKNF